MGRGEEGFSVRKSGVVVAGGVAEEARSLMSGGRSLLDLEAKGRRSLAALWGRRERAIEDSMASDPGLRMDLGLGLCRGWLLGRGGKG